MEHFSHSDAAIPADYGPYSYSIIAGDCVFRAGQTARESATGRVIEGDTAAQTARSLEISRDILREHDHRRVLDGASDLIVEVFGDAGRRARTAVGVSALPLGASVEIEAIFEVVVRRRAGDGNRS